MAKLRFNAVLVKRLIDHARASKLHRASYEQAYEMLGDEWIEGRVSAETIRDRVPAALHLVHDQGIYLMSNGDPVLPGAAFGQKTLSAVVYANGYDPQIDEDYWEKSCAAVGGDDFVEHIDISELPTMPPTATYLEINVSPKQLTLGWVDARARARLPKMVN